MMFPMDGSDWPEARLWVKEQDGRVELRFTPLDGWMAMTAPLAREPAALARLGSCVRAAVVESTGIGRYPEAALALHAGETAGFPTGPHKSMNWPKLPYMVHRRSDGTLKQVILGARRYAESSGKAGVPGAAVMAFPYDLEVIRTFDRLVRIYSCRLVGTDGYPKAIAELNAIARKEAAKLRRSPAGPARKDWQTPGTWTTIQTPARKRIPDWVGRDPNVILVGLPGLGKRHGR